MPYCNITFAIQECMFVDSGFIIIEEFTSTESEELKLDILLTSQWLDRKMEWPAIPYNMGGHVRWAGGWGDEGWMKLEGEGSYRDLQRWTSTEQRPQWRDPTWSPRSRGITGGSTLWSSHCEVMKHQVSILRLSSPLLLYGKFHI